MKQASRKRAHLERVLLLCGPSHAGKSHLIRHMLGDPRLGGQVPVRGPLPVRALSSERCLVSRAMSPEEAGETLEQYLRKIDDALVIAWNSYWRVNYISAIEPVPRGKAPNIVEICRHVKDAFRPERIRIVQLLPDQWGSGGGRLDDDSVELLRGLDVEIAAIDARRSRSGRDVEPGNIRILVDFFDF